MAQIDYMPLWVLKIDTDRDCRNMPDAEFGRYMRLLIRQWIEGDVPADPAVAIRDAGLDHGSDDSVRSLLDRKFTLQNGDNRRNAKCHEERIAVLSKIRKNRKNGCLGGRPKKTERLTQTEPTGPIRASGSGSGSGSGSSSEGAERKPDPPGFAAWWAAWPKHERKLGKAKCLALWRRKGLEGIHARVMAALERSKASSGWRKDSGAYIPGPERWLNQTPWETEDAEIKPLRLTPLNAGAAQLRQCEMRGEACRVALQQARRDPSRNASAAERDARRWVDGLTEAELADSGIRAIADQIKTSLEGAA